MSEYQVTQFCGRCEDTTPHISYGSGRAPAVCDICGTAGEPVNSSAEKIITVVGGGNEYRVWLGRMPTIRIIIEGVEDHVEYCSRAQARRFIAAAKQREWEVTET